MRNVFIECLESENLFCFLHVSANLDSERAAFLTDSAGYTFSGVAIVFPDVFVGFVVFSGKSELQTEDSFGLVHVSANLDSERAAFFTDSAGYAFSRMMFEKFIVFPHRLRYFVVSSGQCEIQELRDGGYVDFLRAGSAV